MAAGVANWATLAAETNFLTPSPMCLSSLGASRGGRLKEAKMVRQSRMVKRAKVGRGTGRLGPAEAAAKSCVNWLSLYRHRARFEAEVAANLVVPAVVLVKGVCVRADETVSIVLAVK